MIGIATFRARGLIIGLTTRFRARYLNNAMTGAIHRDFVDSSETLASTLERALHSTYM